MRVALIQLCASDDPVRNAKTTCHLIAEAAAQADFILTPEVTNCVSTSRTHQNEVLRFERQDETLAACRELAGRFEKWLLIGSLALKSDGGDDRFANRSFLIGPNAEIAAHYDKIHMFDVEISQSEIYRESAGYRPGSQAVVCSAPFGIVGLTICYDLRFPHLFRQLAQMGAQIITVPSAFSPATGAAHWETLLRARAIETGAYILAPAQTGHHDISKGKPRKTYGHSMVVAPWGELVADGGTDVGITYVDLDLQAVDDARGKIPSLTHDRSFEGP